MSSANTQKLQKKSLSPTKLTGAARSFPKNAWFDNQCKCQKRIVNNCKQLWLIQPSVAAIRDEYLKLYKSLIKRKKQYYQSQLHSKLLVTHSKRPHELWNLINKLNPVSKKITSVSPTLLFLHFKSLNEQEEVLTSIPTNIISNQIHMYVEERDTDIVNEEVRVAIRNMKTKKAPGQDRLTVEVYKSFNNQLINLLTKLFNNVLKAGEYPTAWSQGLICPIYKSGSSDDPNNYRGITLLNCIGKIFTSILY